MNIVELTEKNIQEAKNLFVVSQKDFYNAIGQEIEEINPVSLLTDTGDSNVTYMLTDKGTYQCLVTVNKNNAEISNLWINFDVMDEQYMSKFMEFVIKQFSAITLVFIWVDSVNDRLTEVIENYGFEYTGEQDYVSKEKNILKYHYVYKRKK